MTKYLKCQLLRFDKRLVNLKNVVVTVIYNILKIITNYDWTLYISDLQEYYTISGKHNIYLYEYNIKQTYYHFLFDNASYVK